VGIREIGEKGSLSEEDERERENWREGDERKRSLAAVLNSSAAVALGLFWGLPKSSSNCNLPRVRVLDRHV
jgi:hypothetical protein